MSRIDNLYRLSGIRYPMGKQPKGGKQIQTVIEKSDAEALDWIAYEARLSRAELLRKIIRAWVSDYRQEHR